MKGRQRHAAIMLTLADVSAVLVVQGPQHLPGEHVCGGECASLL